jgi:hypothetical protein
VRITKNPKARVPWLELAKESANFLDVETIPEGFKVLDPSKLTQNMVFSLLGHWRKRRDEKKPILVFAKAQKQDLRGFYNEHNHSPMAKK